jgi:energy-coupling factor transporter ATP-binding protein EcfA2
MNARQVGIKNFRLLRDVQMALDERVTVVVGRNNSGKTSLAELFHRLLSEKPVFRLEDFSLEACNCFWDAFLKQAAGADNDEVRALIPSIEVRITFEYPKGATDLGSLSDLVVDLNPETEEAVALIRYDLGPGKIEPLFEGFDESLTTAKPPDKTAFFSKLRERVPRLFGVSLAAVDPQDPSNERSLDWQLLHRLLQCDFVNADRGLDDTTRRDKDVLGKVIEALFMTAMADSASPEDHEAAKALSDAVEEMQDGMDGEFHTFLEPLKQALNLLGYPGLGDPGLGLEVTLDPQKLFQNHTHVRYAGAEGLSLPETYNGLGSRNLILILLQLLQFFREQAARAVSPVAHLVFIEEPEAHLHPQMQEAFIRMLSRVAEFFAEEYGGGHRWPVQFVVSTHSPHLANEASFDSIRYFMVAPELEPARSRATVVKDLRDGLGGEPVEDREFLHKYMTLTRCDLLFADKAVLIEGATERLMMPRMIEKADEGQTGCPSLASQYVSVVEVGGAYAHRFFGLLEFLELRTLVITDLDSVDAERKKCAVSKGVATSNACIGNWFGNQGVSAAELIARTDAEKSTASRRLAYQVPEVANGPCGRSFEDAFMLANPELFDLQGLTAEAAEERALDLAANVSKTDFAIQYGIADAEWTAPRYVLNGLQWLACGPAAVTVPPTAATAADEQPAEDSA